MATEQPTPKLSVAQRRAAVAAAYSAGETMEAIAASLGTGIGTVCRDLKAAGVAARQRRKDDIQPGGVFGRLTALEPSGVEDWLCRCSCGRQEVANATALRLGRHVRCAACRRPETPPETKACRKCERVLPNTEEHFHRNRQFRLGLVARCKDCIRPRTRRDGLRLRRALRLEVLTHYAGGEPRCACCGEATLEFLCLDHLEGSSREDYKTHQTSHRFCAWLRRNGYPRKMQVLCHNCNAALAHHGCCPHRPEITRPVKAGDKRRTVLPAVTEAAIALAEGVVQECYSCHLVLPKSDSFFPRHPLMTAGILNLCRLCDNTRRRESGLAERREQRLAVLRHYSNGEMCCACCRTEVVQFLTIDHVDNGGKRHRDQLVEPLYRFLFRNGFPADVRLRVLCFSCNQARGFYGSCPHGLLT